MKFLSLAFGSILLLFAATCNNSDITDTVEAKNTIKATGTIEATGITSYQYGSHTLKNDNETYALKSETIELEDYEGERVTIIGKKVEGYPLEGGPILLEVLEVQE